MIGIFLLAEDGRGRIPCAGTDPTEHQTMTPEQQLVADFLAKGGTVQRVETGAATMSHNEWKHAVRGTAPATVIDRSDFYREQTEEIARENFMDARMSGQSIDNAMDEYNETRFRRNNKGW